MILNTIMFFIFRIINNKEKENTTRDNDARPVQTQLCTRALQKARGCAKCTKSKMSYKDR